MLVGTITVDGQQIGVVTWSIGERDTFTPDLSDYAPEGRAEESPLGMEPPARSSPHEPAHPGRYHLMHRAERHRAEPETTQMGPEGRAHKEPEPKTTQMGPEGNANPVEPGAPVAKGSATVNAAIEEAAKAHHLSPSFMKSVASIESGMDPSSNANNGHKYKGLYQLGPDEWRRTGDNGNIYNAHDNAMAAARLFEANANVFKKKFGRDPTDTEMYLMHQQGLGFYTNGTMTNIGGNLPRDARTPENMTHEGFERYWGNQVARRKAQFDQQNPTSSVPEASLPPATGSSHPNANYFRGEPPPASAMKNVTTAGGHSFTINPMSSESIKGFVEDLEKAGAPIDEVVGYNRRPIAGTNRWSQHAYGNAIDINQSSRNVTSKAFEEWRKTHDADLRAALEKHNMVSGGDWRNPDWGHFEWGGPKRGSDNDKVAGP